MDRSSSSPRPLKRTRIACLACKQKKQRCDGMQPACGNCLRAKRDCTIEDPSSKRQLPLNYISILESRIAELERLLGQVHPDLIRDHIDVQTLQDESSETANNNQDHDQDQSPDQDGLENGSREHLSAHDPSNKPALQQSDITTLCMSAASGQMLYFGETSGLALSKLLGTILGAVRLQAPGLSLSGPRNSVLQGLPKPLPASLPEPTFGGLLVDAYFQHVHPMYPFLHRPTFRCWESQVRQALSEGRTPDPAHHFFVYIVHAIGALINPAFSPCPAECLYASAELYLERLLGYESLESVQAILACAMYSMRSTTGAPVWTLSGIALRQCTDLGLHRASTRIGTDVGILQDQLQRRVFWVAYNLDRIAAISTGRPFGIAEDDIDAEYPLDVDDEDIDEYQLLANPRTHHLEPPTLMSVALHNLRLRRIWGDMKSRIFCVQTPSPPHSHASTELKARLDSWLVECPRAASRDQMSGVPYGSYKWHLLTYHHSVILFHRQSLVTHSRDGYPDSPEMTAVYLECAKSATILCNLYKELYLGPGLSGNTWGALHILFLAGLTFVYCLWVDAGCRHVHRRDAISTGTSCTVSLVIMAERWPAAQPFRDAFLALWEATQSMLVEREDEQRNPAQASNPHPLPRLPIIRPNSDPAMTQHLAQINGMGTCFTSEHLLSEMVRQ
ncbi:fungal-specific transcription factor domain-containing protein [Microdochium trichocladiopsis]|uniref:Fungal-specific transcription factor domain-containing protein n=1 Tax=Microdochium trichocladiopsis TaxID=1682393 RepID=A0A9P9BPA2_9PEZI|nr:fungal-specific transcription factor domain-containing protein [Microdochium trichocladiopsis]KAH7024341.1 fungal-specific transcription factor domain-containing protein [Microdochium trichocladiopsis]